VQDFILVSRKKGKKFDVQNDHEIGKPIPADNSNSNRHYKFLYQSKGSKCVQQTEEDIIMEKLLSMQHEIERSKFFMDSRETILKRTSSASVLDVVAYGVGSFFSSKVSLCQLSFLLLLWRELKLRGDLYIFDPVFTPSEILVLGRMGVNLIQHNEQGKRKVENPTIFFYASLWSRTLQQRVVGKLGTIFGTHFCAWQQLSQIL